MNIVLDMDELVSVMVGLHLTNDSLVVALSELHPEFMDILEKRMELLRSIKELHKHD